MKKKGETINRWRGLTGSTPADAVLTEFLDLGGLGAWTLRSPLSSCTICVRIHSRGQLLVTGWTKLYLLHHVLGDVGWVYHCAVGVIIV